MRRICVSLVKSLKFDTEIRKRRFPYPTPFLLQAAQLPKTVVMSARQKGSTSRQNETRPTRNSGTFGSDGPNTNRNDSRPKRNNESGWSNNHHDARRQERNHGNHGSGRQYKFRGPLPGAARSLEEAQKKYEYFWGKESPFSQFRNAPFKIDGITFNCAEQYMMYKKAELFRDREVASEILKSHDPLHMKSMGRKVRNFDEGEWNDNCLKIVEDGTEAKFSQNEDLKEQLFATHPKILAEASPVDAIWGIGLEPDSPRAWDQRTWRGRNQLGFILTKVRNKMMEEAGLIAPEKVNEAYEKAKKKYEFFWQKESPFSQWHPAYFTVNGVEYNCAEQYMMYNKAVLFNDKETADKILWAKNPRDQKSLGRQVAGFDEKIWHENCRRIVEDGNVGKFSQNSQLKKILLDTHPKILVEASPVDDVWGIGLAEDNELAWDETTWEGTNLLGYALTNVRERLMKGEGASDSMPEPSPVNHGNVVFIEQSKKKNSKSKASEGKNATAKSTGEAGEITSLDQAKKKFTFFWQKDSPLSQIHKSSFKVEGIEYNTAEQYLMHQKAVFFGDEETADRILRSKDGKGQKSLGQKVKNVDEDVWKEKCLEIAEKGNLEKFSQNKNFNELLIATHPKTLVFANPHDEFWGIGLKKEDEEAWDEGKWKGENHLGQVLSKVRDQLMKS